MRLNKARFGRKIKARDLKVGDILSITTMSGNIMYGKVQSMGGPNTCEDVIGYFEEYEPWNRAGVPILAEDSVWLEEVLSIYEVNNFPLSQKPFIIECQNENTPNEYLRDATYFSDHTDLISLAKAFSSFSEASSYLLQNLDPTQYSVIMLRMAD